MSGFLADTKERCHGAGNTSRFGRKSSKHSKGKNTEGLKVVNERGISRKRNVKASSLMTQEGRTELAAVRSKISCERKVFQQVTAKLAQENCIRIGLKKKTSLKRGGDRKN